MKMKLILKSLFLLLAVVAAPLSINYINSNSDNYVATYALNATIEEFLNKFDELFSDKSICDETREEYNEIITIYSNLSNEDRAVVNQIERQSPDGDKFKIEEAMKELVRMFYISPNSAINNKKKLDQTTTIIIASVVSIVGMSAISVLFILKNNKYIE